MKRLFGISVAVAFVIASVFSSVSCSDDVVQKAPSWACATWTGSTGGLGDIVITENTVLLSGAVLTFGVVNKIEGQGNVTAKVLTATDTVFEVSLSNSEVNYSSSVKFKIEKKGDKYEFRIWAPGNDDYQIQGEVTKKTNGQSGNPQNNDNGSVPEWVRGAWQQQVAGAQGLETTDAFVFTADSVKIPVISDEALKFGTSFVIQMQGVGSVSVLCKIITKTDAVFEFSMIFSGTAEIYYKLVKEGAAGPFAYKCYTKNSEAAQYSEAGAIVIVKKTS